MKKVLLLFGLLSLLLVGCGGQPVRDADTLVYASEDYTRINPALDEHGEINILLFNGLTARDGDNAIVPGLAQDWQVEEDGCRYVFQLDPDVRWHDGAPFTAEDVKFTFEAIMDPANGSENAPNYEDITAIEVLDDHTVAFQLAAPNAAFLDYMTMAILPQHLLDGEDWQTSEFFRHPIGTGPYRLADWQVGQAIILERNEDYFQEPAKIGTIIFKIVTDDNARALQMQAGELDLALLTPKDTARFTDRGGYTVYRMQTADYRGILFNFQHDYWNANRDIIPAICCALDRQAIVDTVLLGHGITAHGPLQRNPYYYADTEHWDYDPQRAESILQAAGCVKNADGFYERDGAALAFVLSVGAGDQVRLDIAQAAAQMLQAVGIRCTVEVPEQVDWAGQMAYLIGWGSPFDADDHTYKVFGTGKGANYSGYSNAAVDEALIRARQTTDPTQRAAAYADFQTALALDPAFAFVCYVDADYVATDALTGIDPDTVMGHHGVGIFWNVTEWELVR